MFSFLKNIVFLERIEKNEGSENGREKEDLKGEND